MHEHGGTQGTVSAARSQISFLDLRFKCTYNTLQIYLEYEWEFEFETLVVMCI